jgi:DHA3 family macrolide efflux protein-like MFS transporter
LRGCDSARGSTAADPQFADWKRKIVLFLGSQTISLFGSSLVQYAIMWHITLETQSGAMMTIYILAGLLPMFFVAPFAGVWADRYSRRLLIILADALIAIATLVVALLFMARARCAVAALRGGGDPRGGRRHSDARGRRDPAADRPDGAPDAYRRDQRQHPGDHRAGLADRQWRAAGGGRDRNDLLHRRGDRRHRDRRAEPAPERPGRTRRRWRSAAQGYYADLRQGWDYVNSHSFLKVFFTFNAVFFVLIAPAAFLTPLQVTRSFGPDVWRLTAIELAYAIGMMLGGALMASWGGFRNRTHTMGLSTVAIGIAHARARQWFRSSRST